jgi:hypothetical protein
MKEMLFNPAAAMINFWKNGQGIGYFMDFIVRHYLLIYGWCLMLPFLAVKELEALKKAAERQNVHLVFVVTTRDAESHLLSELHHWVVCDQEKYCQLSARDRKSLLIKLNQRMTDHSTCIRRFEAFDNFCYLRLSDISIGWASCMGGLDPGILEHKWGQHLSTVGMKNKSHLKVYYSRFE